MVQINSLITYQVCSCYSSGDVELREEDLSISVVVDTHLEMLNSAKKTYSTMYSTYKQLYSLFPSLTIETEMIKTVSALPPINRPYM